MASSPQRNQSSFNEEEFTTQKKAQLRIRFPNKSEAQINRMANHSLEKEKKRVLQTNRPSTNQRNQNISNQRQPSGNQNSPQVDPRKKLVYYSENRIPVIVPLPNLEVELIPSEPSVTRTPERQRTRKVKKIKKDQKDLSKNILEQYYGFSRYYRQKLKSQHPRWTFRQITDIIKLLWRKKKLTDKKLSTHLIIIKKPRTGRKFFGDMKRKEQKMEAAEIRKIWSRLPRETRLYFGRKGAGKTGKNEFTRPISTMTKKIEIRLFKNDDPVTQINQLQSLLRRSYS